MKPENAFNHEAVIPFEHPLRGLWEEGFAITWGDPDEAGLGSIRYCVKRDDGHILFAEWVGHDGKTSQIMIPLAVLKAAAAAWELMLPQAAYAAHKLMNPDLPAPPVA